MLPYDLSDDPDPVIEIGTRRLREVAPGVGSIMGRILESESNQLQMYTQGARDRAWGPGGIPQTDEAAGTMVAAKNFTLLKSTPLLVDVDSSVKNAIHVIRCNLCEFETTVKTHVLGIVTKYHSDVFHGGEKAWHDHSHGILTNAEMLLASDMVKALRPSPRYYPGTAIPALGSAPVDSKTTTVDSKTTSDRPIDAKRSVSPPKRPLVCKCDDRRRCYMCYYCDLHKCHLTWTTRATHFSEGLACDGCYQDFKKALEEASACAEVVRALEDAA
jgi:hypothetical protein